MSSLAHPPRPPHFHEHSRLSPSRSSMLHTTSYLPTATLLQQATMSNRSHIVSAATPSSSRKRKASPSEEDDESMSMSPAISHARLPPTQSANRKRIRTNLEGRPLTFDRLLETLDKDSLTTMLRTLTTSHPHLKDEIVHLSPRPSITSTLQVLRTYYNKLRTSFPLDPNPRSDYSYDRVRPQWNDLLNALADFTPHFLPPNESQSNISLEYLDGVTNIIHDLPEWDTPSHNLAKQNAYEEISRAWAVVIREAGKRGGGFQLQYGGWEEKVGSHNQRSGGLMKEAFEELMSSLGWLRSGGSGAQGGGFGGVNSRESIRQQLFSGTYGPDSGMRTGTW